MKQIIEVILSLTMMVSLTACISNESFRNSSFNNVCVGDYVEFGDYNWQVLDVKNGNALIISERILEYRPYHNKAEDITWKDCDLRTYLNTVFYESFSEEERSKIMLTKNENPDNPWDFTEQNGNAFSEGGENTEDYIFLLSLDEVIKYYSEDGENSMLFEPQLGASEVKLSDGYEDRRVAYYLSGNLSMLRGNAWFLRSPGMYQDAASYVGGKGSIAVCGTWVEETDYGVRPAMWIKNANSLPKSSVTCCDVNCTVCKKGVYSDTPEVGSTCVICGYVGVECTNKVAHNRLYHDWMYNYITISDEMLEEVYLIEDEFKREWFSLFELLCDGESSTDSESGKLRVSQIISHQESEKIKALMLEETSAIRNYKGMTSVQFNEAKAYLRSRTELLREVEDVLQQAINKANSSAITFDEKMIGLFNSIFYETVRTATKEAAADSNRLLWDSGYYHALFGDRIANIAYTEFEQMLENEIDELFGSNKVRAWADDGEAMLDGYLEAVFFSEK